MFDKIRLKKPVLRLYEPISGALFMSATGQSRALQFDGRGFAKEGGVVSNLAR